MRGKRFVAVFMMLAIAVSCLAFKGQNVHAEERGYVNTSQELFDDFDGNSIDTDKWLVVKKAWGGNNGGCVPENVSVSDGTLKLEGHGLNYSGNVPGIKRPDGKLTGAAIATKQYYASGSYEVKAKIAPELGACSAIWTFEYEEVYEGEPGFDPKYAIGGEYCTINHEIDIEIPTATSKNKEPNFSSARFNSFVRENDYTSKKFDLDASLNDGQYHIYRFDWHTGSDTETPRVDFYIDGVMLYTINTDIPTNEGRFWIGLWFPCSIDSDGDKVWDSGWAGKADFDTTVFEIDYVRIIPYHEAGDTEQHENYPYDGWADNSFPELAVSENYEHVVNGDFSNGNIGWNLEDEAKIENGEAVLSSGQVIDKVWQIVNVVPCASYTFTADVVTDGSKVTVGVSKENGTDNKSYVTNKSGKVTITFNNDNINTTYKIYVSVDRYQGNNVRVTADNLSFKGASYVDCTKIDFTPLNPDDTEPETVANLVVNGDFSQGGDGWTKSGSARIEDGAAYLASGSDVDTISQTVDVEKGETYTLSADITSTGAEIELGVKRYNGRYTTYSEKYTKDGHYYLTFTVGADISSIEVFASVNRYQSNGEDCSIDNISLVRGTIADSNLEYIVEGYSLDLKNGSFYLNIYTDFPAEAINYSVKLELPDGTDSVTKVSSAATSKIGDKTYRIFNASVAAKDMKKYVSVYVLDDRGQQIGNAYKVSVYDYACVLKSRVPSYSEFIDAMINYGEYAQSYFYGQAVNSGNSIKQYSSADYVTIAQTISAHSGINATGYIGSSLLLENRITLRHYFSKPVNGAVENGGIYYVQQVYDSTQFDSIFGGYNYSVNDYIKTALTGNYDTKLKNLMCALYEYEVQAKEL